MTIMILVTGATGDIGGEVTRQLVQGGQKVRVLARDPAKAARMLGSAVEVAKGDLLQKDSLTEAFAGATKVFLMAHAADLPAAAEHALAAAKQGGARHVVLLSSNTTLMEPIGAIGRWHLAAEQQLEATGIAWTMLRPGNFASNSLRWAPMIKAQGAVFGPAGGKSTPIDPYDIASVAVKALTTAGHEGKKHLLTGSERLTAAEQIDIIGAALGKTLRYVEVPDEGARAGMLKAGMPEVLADALLELIRLARTGREPATTTTVRDVTGAEPRTFAMWVEAHVSAFK
jgi:uncharacterized protein YbjT (DUF2867 family)